MKKIKIVFESDTKKLGYVIDVEMKNFKSCNFDDKYQETDVAQDQFIDNPRFFVQQIVSVLMGALRS
jgi:hypothetical protein